MIGSRPAEGLKDFIEEPIRFAGLGQTILRVCSCPVVEVLFYFFKTYVIK
jgi:hypothetical protein